MDNPQTAVDAIVDNGHIEVGGISCKPITAGRYAWLELVDSPFVDFEQKFNVSNLVTSLYICQLETDQLRKYSRRDIAKLEEDAFAWADTIDLDKVGPAVDYMLEQFKLVMKISPGTGSAENGEKKRPEEEMTTAGSQQSSTLQ